MKKYQVLFSKTAAKEIRRLPNEMVSRILEKSRELATEPRPAGCKKLVGEKEQLWRIRAGDYRIIYSIDDTILVIDIRRIAHRRDVYNR